MKNIRSLGILGAACMALIASRAMAATVSYTDGDLFLGFRSTDGTQSYLVDIGQPSQFVNAPPGSTIHITLASSIDLSNVFGADWFTRIDPNTGRNAVLWAVVGGRLVAGGGDSMNTLYSTNPNATAWNRGSNSAQSGITSLTDSLGTTYDGNQSTANSPGGIIQMNSSANTWATFQPGGNNSGGISFQFWNPTNEGTPNQTLFFNRIVPGSGPGQLLGSFNISTDGSLTFSAVPEPSTIASSVAGAALLVAVMMWRRKSTGAKA
jgi:hypothetical protein